MKKSIYSKPKVCKSVNGWYVYFRYNGHLKRYKFGINYIKDLKQREIEANSLAKVLHRKLKKGWNPLLPEASQFSDEMLFTAALNFALEKKKKDLAPKSYSGYKGTVNFIKTAVESLHLSYLTISELKRPHIRTIMDECKRQRKWSNKAYNKHLNHLKAVLSELIQWDILEVNPAHKIKNLPVEESTANTPANIEQHKIIKEHLKENHFSFFVFVATIYHTGIRIWEALQLKASMIDFENKMIYLPAEITKNRRDRVVPMNQHLEILFYENGVYDVPGEYYLFGSFREPGKGNLGKHKDFIPGPTRLKRDTATKRWKRIVKDGLGIDVNLYSNKHAGANAKILAGIDLDSLRELYGHTSKMMTVKYAKVVKDVYRKEIMDKSPEF